MYAFIDARRTESGAICAVLQIAWSGHCRHHQLQTDASRRSARAQRDAWLQELIQPEEQSCRTQEAPAERLALN